ncbi:MAG: anthranilate phosphoribosyltransferase, partial [bacterium]
PVSPELVQFGKRLLDKDKLTPQEAERAMEIMIGGRSSPYETGLFLTALRTGIRTPEELAAMARVMRAHSIHVTPSPPSTILGDNCGTGGDGLHLFNVSTATMFILAAAGTPIAKHGNRASTSRCGSADVLDALGVRIDLGPEAVARCIKRAGIGFMFAPRYHPAMKNVAAVRRNLPFHTIFNLLGPLCNPAPISFQLLGVYHPDVIDLAAQTLMLLDLPRALVVCGEAGVEEKWMDEVSISGRTHAVLIDQTTSRRIEIDPLSLGMSLSPLDPLRGGTPTENASILRGILDGSDTGPRRDLCLINAAAGLYAAGMVGELSGGLTLARETLENGGALAKLEGLIEESNREKSQ